MGWMHDTLAYFALDPLDRKFHQVWLTFRMLYAFAENFVLPLSHDEVVYGKRSLLAKMPGDDWQKFASLRLLLGCQFAQPGKKLLFMGGDFGQGREWNHDASLDWDLLEKPQHRGVHRWVSDLNRLYRTEPALHSLDCDAAGFEWIACDNAAESTIAFLRKGLAANEALLVACNFTPVPRHGYRIGVPRGGRWEEVLNSDAPIYGGSGQGNLGGIAAEPVSWQGRPHMLTVTLPPLAIVIFKAPSADQVVDPV
jgi:1,4-alpha-glucan branching enzyme